MVWDENGRLIYLEKDVEDSFEISAGIEVLAFEDFKLDPRKYGGKSLSFSEKELYVRDAKEGIYAPLIEKGSIKVSVRDEDNKEVKELLIKVKKAETDISYKEDYRNNKPVKFKRVEKVNPLLPQGSENILVKGEDGIRSDLYKYKYKKGELVYTYEFKSMLLKEAVDQVVEVAGEEPLEEFISKGARVRNEKGIEIGYLAKNQLIKGVSKGDRVSFIYKEERATVHKNFLIKVEDKVYLSNGARIRDDKEVATGYLKKGQLIEGRQKGSKIYFEQDNKTFSVHKDFVIEQAKEDYVSRGANLRDLDNKKVGYLNKGEKIRASLVGERVYYRKEGKMVSADIKFIEDSRPHKFYSRGAVVRDLYGKKIGYLKSQKVIAGRKSGNDILFTYGDTPAKVDKDFVSLSAYRGYISKGVNVRNVYGEIIGFIKKGDLVFGRVYAHDSSLVEIEYRRGQGLLDNRFVE